MQSPTENPPIYGKNAVVELLRSDVAVDTVLLADTLDGKTAGYLTALAKEAGAVVKRTRTEKLNMLCGEGKHQGIAAFSAQVEYSCIEDILEIAKARNEPPFVLVADGVEDPHNLGALLRTALLCGAHGAVIPQRGAAAVTPVVMKASAGAAARIAVARVVNIGEALRRLKKEGLFAYCTDMQGYPAHKQNLTGPIVLVMGGEGQGVSPLVRKLCDSMVSLPMAEDIGTVDSFNVSVAGGIVMYEIFRQRRI